MTASNSNGSADRASMHDASWLRREMARAAEEVPSVGVEQASVHEAVDQCAELLSRFWPADGETAHSSCHAIPLLPIGPDLVAGTRLGRFEILRCLGHGGFGIVFLVFDSRLNREAALKIPRPEVLLSRALRDLFLREAQAVAALDHPGIVPIFEIGEIGPVGYILSAYCKGPTLARWLRDQSAPVAPRAAARIVEQLAEAVQHAHARAILHRDIKPANVLLEPQDETPNVPQSFVPRLSDFGLAKRLDRSLDSSQPRTVLGTPWYMAPEQAAGNEGEVGVHSDVYALGVILFELLTLKASNDALRGEVGNLLEAEGVRQELRGRHIPRDLASICTKCLSYRPADRYGTARELANDLRRFVAGEPVTARPLRRDQRILSWSRRRPLVSALCLGLIVAVVTGIVVAGWQWMRAEDHLRESIAAAAQARQGQSEAEQALTDLAWLVEESSLWDQEASQVRDAVHEKLQRYEKAILDGDGRHSTPITAAAFSFAARNAAQADDFVTADANYRLALDAWRSAAEQHPNKAEYQRALALCLLRYSQLLRGHALQRGETDSAAVLRAFYANVAADHRYGLEYLYGYATLLRDYGAQLLQQRNREQALAVLETAICATGVLVQEAPDTTHYRFIDGQLWCLLAEVQQERRDSSASHQARDHASEILERLLVDEPSNAKYLAALAEVNHQRGLMYDRTGERQKAIDSLISSIGLCNRLASTKDANYGNRLRLAISLRYLGHSLFELGKLDESMAAYAQHADVLEDLKRRHELIPVDEWRGVARAHYNFGVHANGNNNFEAATVLFAKAAEMFTTVSDSGAEMGGADTRHWAECYYFTARYWESAGNSAEAIRNHEKVVKLLQDQATRRAPPRPILDRYRKSTAAIEKLKKELDDD